jgi:hypothetical protein
MAFELVSHILDIGERIVNWFKRKKQKTKKKGIITEDFKSNGIKLSEMKNGAKVWVNSPDPQVHGIYRIKKTKRGDSFKLIDKKKLPKQAFVGVINPNNGETGIYSSMVQKKKGITRVASQKIKNGNEKISRKQLRQISRKMSAQFHESIKSIDEQSIQEQIDSLSIGEDDMPRRMEKPQESQKYGYFSESKLSNTPDNNLLDEKISEYNILLSTSSLGYSKTSTMDDSVKEEFAKYKALDEQHKQQLDSIKQLEDARKAKEAQEKENAQQKVLEQLQAKHKAELDKMKNELLGMLSALQQQKEEDIKLLSLKEEQLKKKESE